MTLAPPLCLSEQQASVAAELPSLLLRLFDAAEGSRELLILVNDESEPPMVEARVSKASEPHQALDAAFILGEQAWALLVDAARSHGGGALIRKASARADLLALFGPQSGALWEREELRERVEQTAPPNLEPTEGGPPETIRL